MARNTILTIPYSGNIANVDTMFFKQVDKKWVLFSDGVTGLYAWDSSTTAPYKVKDFVKYLPNNNGSSADSSNYANLPYVPGLYYLIWFRGRLFGCNPMTSTVYYSGTRQDLTTTEPSSREIRPWELWNLQLDLSRYNPSYGGSMIIGDRSQQIRGLMETESGILVFKDSSIYLWSYPDNAAPHEVEMGARVELISEGIGLVSHTSLAADGGTVYFLGRSNRGAISLYRMVNGQFQNLSVNSISKEMNDIIHYDLTTNQPIGILFDNKYHIIVDYGSGVRQMKFVYDIANDSWYEYTSPEVECATVIGDHITLGGTNGIVYMYPYGSSDTTESGISPIDWSLRTMQIDAGDPFSDKKYRELSFYVECVDESGDVLTEANTSIDSDIHMYDTTGGYVITPTDPHSHAITGVSDIRVPLSTRGKAAIVELSGSTSTRFNIKQIRLGWRERLGSS